MKNQFIKNSLPEGTYLLQDNGVRCFIPPCFSWNLLSSNGELITTVSAVDFSFFERAINIKEIEPSLANTGIQVYGYAEPQPESNGVRQAVTFFVTRLQNDD